MMASKVAVEILEWQSKNRYLCLTGITVDSLLSQVKEGSLPCIIEQFGSALYGDFLAASVIYEYPKLVWI
jgi:hypothetical protein